MRKTDFARVSRRTSMIAAGLGVIGTVVAAVLGGGSWALGFAVGAAFSELNFWLWQRTVRRVGEGGSGGVTMFGLRYAGFVLAGYAILNYFEANVLAALTGCFIAVAAVLLEILLELIYGT